MHPELPLQSGLQFSWKMFCKRFMCKFLLRFISLDCYRCTLWPRKGKRFENINLIILSKKRSAGKTYRPKISTPPLFYCILPLKVHWSYLQCWGKQERGLLWMNRMLNISVKTFASCRASDILPPHKNLPTLQLNPCALHCALFGLIDADRARVGNYLRINMKSSWSNQMTSCWARRAMSLSTRTGSQITRRLRINVHSFPTINTNLFFCNSR